jgi:hypothetical protein
MTSAYTIASHNLDGTGSRPTRVYALAAGPQIAFADGSTHPTEREYWPAVTDVPCPVCATGTIRWAEAGYTPGYRICDGCGRHFVAAGDAAAPTLLRMGSRRSRV